MVLDPEYLVRQMFYYHCSFYSLQIVIFMIAVYMSQHRCLWEDDAIFNTQLSLLSAPTNDESLKDTSEEALPSSEEALPSSSKKESYGPGALGFTYELCAGIVDKKMSLPQIAQEEILEETGTQVVC